MYIVASYSCCCVTDAQHALLMMQLTAYADAVNMLEADLVPANCTRCRLLFLFCWAFRFACSTGVRGAVKGSLTTRYRLLTIDFDAAPGQRAE